MKYSVWLLRDQRGVGRTDTWFPMPLRAIALPTEDRGHHIHEETLHSARLLQEAVGQHILSTS